MDSSQYVTGSFKLYDQDRDGYITKVEMQEIVGAIYQMVVSHHQRNHTSLLWNALILL